MTGPTRRDVAVAGHKGDVDTATAGLASNDGNFRATALGALERLGELADEQLITAFSDDDARVRRRAAELAATHLLVDLVPLLADPDVNVVEMAAWTTGEHESNRPAVLDRLLELAEHAEEPLVREASVAALGAIGDPAAVDVIIAACSDKPAVRRRAVLALAPFEGAAVEATIDQALEDRDWQVRQAAEDLRRVQARPN